MTVNVIYYDWTKESMAEILLKEPDDFLKIKETLTRIGIPSKKENILYQTCHILHKQGRYFIVHFKELFALDNKESSLTVSDIERRNAIVKLLSEWKLLEIINPKQVENSSTISQIKIVPHKEKKNWQLIPKYQIGTKAN